MLAELGIALLFNSWIVLLWPILIYPIWSRLVLKEEKMMTEVFGEEYEQYAARTGRFIPRFSNALILVFNKKGDPGKSAKQN